MRNMESKNQLRKRVKQLRNEIPGMKRREYSRKIAFRLMGQPWYENADKILVYSAIQSEVDLSEFCLKAWKDGKQLYYPKVSGDRMEFFCIQNPEQLQRGSFGVMEPDVVHQTLQVYHSDGIRVPVLVPGVVFSRKGQRIGYGKGYYDRYLSGHPELYAIGICYEAQLSDEIEAEPQDVAMNKVITELKEY